MGAPVKAEIKKTGSSCEILVVYALLSIRPISYSMYLRLYNRGRNTSENIAKS